MQTPVKHGHVSFLCVLEHESIDMQNLKKIYQVLGKKFKLDLFDFEDTFLKNLNEKEFSYKVKELGYVIDIAHQLYLAHKDSREIKFMKSLTFTIDINFGGKKKVKGIYF